MLSTDSTALEGSGNEVLKLRQMLRCTCNEFPIVFLLRCHSDGQIFMIHNYSKERCLFLFVSFIAHSILSQVDLVTPPARWVLVNRNPVRLAAIILRIHTLEQHGVHRSLDVTIVPSDRHSISAGRHLIYANVIDSAH